MNLISLTGQFAELAELAANAVTADEVQMFADTLEGLTGELQQKILGIGSVIREMKSREAAIDAEIDRLASRKATNSASIERLKEYALRAMQATGVRKVAGPLYTVSILATRSVAIDDETKIPPYVLVGDKTVFLRRHKPAPPPELNKVEIGNILKAGLPVPGCHMQERESLQIR